MKVVGDISDKLRDKPYIYRIELLDRFEKLLSNKELVLVRPSTWSDPLENLIFNAKLIKDGKEYHHPIKDKIYSQCWSYEGDSYALWQIYTTKKNDEGEFKRHMGVRIATKLDKLQQISSFNIGDFYYGQVNYLWKYQLEKLPKDLSVIKSLRDTNLNENHLKTLLVKRKSYHYENEVRLLANPSDNLIDKTDNRLCRLKIDPMNFITSVRFDPAMPYKDFKSKKEELIDKFGFRPKQIKQSTYFKKNKFVIKL